MYYDSEIPSYLKMVRGELDFQAGRVGAKKVRWMFAQGMIVVYEDGGYAIYEDFKYKQSASNIECGECVAFSETAKGIIPEIKYYRNERGM